LTVNGQAMGSGISAMALIEENWRANLHSTPGVNSASVTICQCRCLAFAGLFGHGAHIWPLGVIKALRSDADHDPGTCNLLNTREWSVLFRQGGVFVSDKHCGETIKLL